MGDLSKHLRPDVTVSNFPAKRRYWRFSRILALCLMLALWFWSYGFIVSFLGWSKDTAFLLLAASPGWITVIGIILTEK